MSTSPHSLPRRYISAIYLGYISRAGRVRAVRAAAQEGGHRRGQRRRRRRGRRRAQGGAQRSAAPSSYHPSQRRALGPAQPTILIWRPPSSCAGVGARVRLPARHAAVEPHLRARRAAPGGARDQGGGAEIRPRCSRDVAEISRSSKASLRPRWRRAHVTARSAHILAPCTTAPRLYLG